MKTLAHLSDLHLGLQPNAPEALGRAVQALAETDLVVVTGDLTEGGRNSELATFERICGPIADKLVVVPGNHDRCGDDVGERLMHGRRVDVVTRPGCTVVRVDSTAPHNRISWLSHGRMCESVLEQVDRALDRAPRHALRVLALHHHVFPLPAEGFWEHVSEALRLPNHSELSLGTRLLEVLRGRCDLVLHGHRHVPRQFVIDGERPLRIFNGGSTTDLGAFRQFEFAGNALSDGQWVQVVPSPRPSPHVRPAPLSTFQLA